MLLDCLKLRKIQKVKTWVLERQKEKNWCFYQNVYCVAVKKSRFIKKQETSGLLSSLRIKSPLRQIPLVDPVLF